ncbi:MAG: helix-turn-helix domain-containing protein [Janthinobacterium lividum]
MARPRSATTATLEATVRGALGLSQQQLAEWLSCSRSFVDACEAGRKTLPLALAGRLLALLPALPPPLGSGPPAAPLPLTPVLPALAWVAPATALPAALASPLAPGPLRVAARTARLAALVAERELLRLHAHALALAVRHRGLAVLQAAPPPTTLAEAARWHTWLAALALDLALADPHPAEAAARRHVLAIRAAARYAEADALEAGAAQAASESS